MALKRGRPEGAPSSSLRSPALLISAASQPSYPCAGDHLYGDRSPGALTTAFSCLYDLDALASRGTTYWINLIRTSARTQVGGFKEPLARRMPAQNSNRSQLLGTSGVSLTQHHPAEQHIT